MSDESTIKAFIKNEQLWRLRDAKEQAQRLIELSTALIRKIETEGLNGRYSINDDCLGVAQRVHRACNDLWRMRTLIEQMELATKSKEPSTSTEPVVQTSPQPKSKRRKKKS